MILKPLLLFAATTAAVGATLAATGLADGSAGSNTPAPVPAAKVVQPVPTDPAVLASFSAFSVKESSPEKTAVTARLQQAYASEPDAPEAQADYSVMRSVKGAAGEPAAWLAPSGSRVCVFIPDPVDGFGASCPTLDQIKGGHNVVILGPSPNAATKTFVVTAPTPDNTAGPQLVHQGGEATTITPNTNLALATAVSSDTVKTSSDTIVLAKLATTP